MIKVKVMTVMTKSTRAPRLHLPRLEIRRLAKEPDTREDLADADYDMLAKELELVDYYDQMTNEETLEEHLHLLFIYIYTSVPRRRQSCIGQSE